MWCGFIFVNTKKNPKPRKKLMAERTGERGETHRIRTLSQSVVEPTGERKKRIVTDKIHYFS